MEMLKEIPVLMPLCLLKVHLGYPGSEAGPFQ